MCPVTPCRLSLFSLRHFWNRFAMRIPHCEEPLSLTLQFGDSYAKSSSWSTYASVRASATCAVPVRGAEVLMLIEIRELERHPVDFQEQIAPGVIDLGSEAKQAGNLESRGRATLVREQHGKHQFINDIRMAGELSVQIEIPCARCLEPIARDLNRKFDLLYRPQGSDAGREELSVTAAEAEIGYYRGEGLLLEDVLREQVLLALPLRVICREDCKGLCPHCGQNLNWGQCNCAEPQEDPRWSALKDIREKLQN